MSRAQCHELKQRWDRFLLAAEQADEALSELMLLLAPDGARSPETTSGRLRTLKSEVRHPDRRLFH